jgi:multiple sugar transport system permease protein
MKINRTLLPYILIAPLFILLVLLTFYPLLLTIFNSLQSLNLGRPDDIRFVGLANYIELMTDPAVLNAMRNSVQYFILSVSIEILGGIVIALSLRNKFRGRAIILGIVILPWALPPVVNSIVWKWIYDPSYGLLNDVLIKLGMIDHFHVWLGDPHFSLVWVALVHIWKMMPLISIIMLAQLQTIPAELYEAARIDGANSLQSFRHITLPLLKPALIIALTLGTVSAFHLFDEVYVLTGTSLDTRSIMVQDYLIAFRELKYSMGMALSLIITIVILALTWFYNQLGKEARM